MRRVIMTAALAALPVSGAFAAATTVTGATASVAESNAAQAGISFTAATGSAAGTEFVVEDFTFNLSAGVGLAFTQDSVAMGVATASTKGNYAFSGLSNGGAVTTCGTKAVSPNKPTLKAPVLANTNGCNP